MNLELPGAWLSPSRRSCAHRDSRPPAIPTAVAGKKVNINQASAKELVNLPRIGAKAADKIVEYRQAHGSLQQGRGPDGGQGDRRKLFTQLKPYVTLSGPRLWPRKFPQRLPRRLRGRPV